MLSLSGMYTTQGMLFLLLMLGLYLKKCGMITDKGERCLSDVTLYVFLPALVLDSFQIDFTLDILTQFLEVLVVSSAVQLGCALLNFILYRKQPKEKRNVLKFCILGNNGGTLGTQVASGFWGAEGVYLASIYCIPLRTVMWSLGMSYFTEAPNPKALAKKVATQPVILATVIGFVMMLSGIRLPGVLALSCEKLSQSCNGTAMIVCGCIMAKVDFHTVFDKTVISYTILRLILIPGVVLACCRIFGVSVLTTQLAVVMAGMPAALNTSMLAEKFGGDDIFASKCVAVTTVLSMVTIPVLCMLTI